MYRQYVQTLTQNKYAIYDNYDNVCTYLATLDMCVDSRPSSVSSALLLAGESCASVLCCEVI